MKKIKVESVVGMMSGLKCENGCQGIIKLNAIDFPAIFDTIGNNYPSLKKDLEKISSKCYNLSFEVTFKTQIGASEVHFEPIIKEFKV